MCKIGKIKFSVHIPKNVLAGKQHLDPIHWFPRAACECFANYSTVECVACMFVANSCSVDISGVTIPNEIMQRMETLVQCFMSLLPSR